MKVKLEHVHYMPKDLQPGILYVSDEFATAAHLCACGCGLKIRTPLGSTEWTLEETDMGPTLRPSIGNWQLPCQSHYWIRQGEIRWSDKWSPEKIAAGRRAEDDRRREYYDHLDRYHASFLRKLWLWFKHFFER